MPYVSRQRHKTINPYIINKDILRTDAEHVLVWRDIMWIVLTTPRIIDPQNAIIIYNLFTFDSEKVKAGEIILKDSTR